MAINMREALIDPSSVFRNPEEILKARIAPEDKLKILVLWEHDLHLMQLCDEENMSGPELEMLRRIHECLRILKNQQRH